MINELIRNIIYYSEVALAKPFYAIVPVLIALVAGAGFILSMPRNYHSEALLLMEFQQIPSTLVSPTVSNDRLQFIEQRVLSRNNLLELADKYDLFPGLRNALPKNNFAGIVRNHITLQIEMTDGADQVARSATVRVGFKYGDPALTAPIVSDLVSRIVDENKRLRTARASETATFLNREMDGLARRFREREAAWTGYIEENKEAHPSRMPTILIELQAKEQELATFERTIVALNEEIRLLEAQLRMGVEQASDANRLHSQIAALEADLAAKSLVYSDAHPQVRAMRQRFEELQSRIAVASPVAAAEMPTAEEIKNLPAEFILVAERIANIKPRQEQTVNQRNELAGRINRLREIISRAPEVEAQIQANEAEKLSLQRSMDEMQAKLDTALLGERLEERQAMQQIDIVEQPEIPTGPSGPRRLYLALAVCVAAGAAGLAGIYAAHLFDGSIRGTFDLAQALAGQTLVVIPRWTPERRRVTAYWRARGNAGPAET
ncbi:hypothetical protein [Rhizobium sp. LCM 4573]|uniref:GumC family protein n=1 Tax=Rhizobium sp. LCM 4573 TaxID=1848291 RepID=UPI0008DA4D6E|nr:hypothetical protein [Rhizobium sp. LCM 4573]OHV84990.1 hypothetical protein LCM4573_04955 [Rhizobium sp. LCM 4573]